MKYLILLILFSISLNAQIRATTEQGKKVILRSDGSWVFDSQNELTSYKNSINCTSVVTKEFSKNGVNLIDPIEENLEDLRTLAMLHSTTFGGPVDPENNLYLQKYNQKLEFLKKLNEERAKGNILIEKRSPLIIVNESPDIAIMLVRSGNQFILSTWPAKKFCVNQYNMVYLKLKDGSILSYNNYHENCDGVAYLSCSERDIINLQKGIISISLDTKDNGMIICNLNEEQNELIIRYINCLLN